jgi:hypothetical protein
MRELAELYRRYSYSIVWILYTYVYDCSIMCALLWIGAYCNLVHLVRYA